MKGEASDVVMETKETASGNDLDTIPLLSPPEIFEVEQGTSKSEESELEKGLGACCRICLESESLAPGDELIAPCMCKGTQQLVHRGCLDHWRSVKVRMLIHFLSISDIFYPSFSLINSQAISLLAGVIAVCNWSFKYMQCSWGK
jgi:hypothetical protein